MQALRMKERLKDIAFSAVFCSPLQRALKTCHLAGLDPVLEPLAVEWDYGSFEGLVYQQICKQKSDWSIFLDGALQGESPDEISERADRLLKKLLSQSGKVALFSHGHFLRALTARWLGLEVAAGRFFALSVASVSILSFEREQHVIKLWNDTPYL